MQQLHMTWYVTLHVPQQLCVKLHAVDACDGCQFKTAAVSYVAWHMMIFQLLQSTKQDPDAALGA